MGKRDYAEILDLVGFGFARDLGTPGMQKERYEQSDCPRWFNPDADKPGHKRDDDDRYKYGHYDGCFYPYLDGDCGFDGYQYPDRYSYHDGDRDRDGYRPIDGFFHLDLHGNDDLD